MIIKIQSKKFGIQKLIIDKKDYPLIKDYTWRIHQDKGQRFYAIAHNKQKIFGPVKTINISHVILNLPTSVIIDHANSDGLDNRRSNLRPATNSQNGANRRKFRPTSSIFKGVTYKKKEKFFAVRLRLNDKIIYGGGFQSEIHAAQKYNELAIKYFGKFARLNEFNSEQKSILKNKYIRPRSIFINNTTGYRGVTCDHRRKNKKFIATIWVKTKNRIIGYFNSPEEAAFAYNKAALRFHGKEAFQNKILI